MKGAAGTLGLERLRQAVSRLEQSLKDGDNIELLKELVHELAAEQRRFHAALMKITAETSPRQNVEVKPGQVEQLLHRLCSLLATDDTDANDLFTQSKALLNQVFGDEIEQLGLQIMSFDYTAAVRSCRALSATFSCAKTSLAKDEFTHKNTRKTTDE